MPDDFQAIINAARTVGKVIEFSGDYAPLILVPQGFSLQSLEPFGAAPRRKTGSCSFQTPESFIRFVETHKTEATVIHTKLDAGAGITATFDHHTKGAAGWNGFKATLQLQQTVEWGKWLSSPGREYNQKQFAEHIEDFIPYFESPTGAEIIQIVETLKVNAKVNVAAVNAEKGRKIRMEFSSETAMTAGADDKLTVPDEIKLKLQPFEGGTAYVLTNKLKVSLKDRALVIQYEPVRFDLIIKDAVKGILQQIHAATKIEPLIGTL